MRMELAPNVANFFSVLVFQSLEVHYSVERLRRDVARLRCGRRCLFGAYFVHRFRVSGFFLLLRFVLLMHQFQPRQIRFWIFQLQFYDSVFEFDKIRIVLKRISIFQADDVIAPPSVAGGAPKFILTRLRDPSIFLELQN